MGTLTDEQRKLVEEKMGEVIPHFEDLTDNMELVYLALFAGFSFGKTEGLKNANKIVLKRYYKGE